MEEEQENDIDGDGVDVVSLKDELAKCSDILAEDEIPVNFTSDNNNNKNSCHNQDPCIPSTSKSSIFDVCKDSIACVPKDEQEEELLNLNISVYDQTEFENEIMNQVDKAIKDQDEKKRREDVNRELQSVVEDISFAKKRLNQLEKALSMAPKDRNVLTNAGKREISAIKKEQENKLKHLKKLEAKQKTLQACISGNVEILSSSLQENIEEDEEMDEETKYHLQKVFAAKETEEERMIRLGQMTPFGTVMNQQSKEKKERKIIIPENELTDFDKFLLNEAESASKKKAEKASMKHSKPSTSKSSFAKVPSKMSPKSSSNLSASPSEKSCNTKSLDVRLNVSENSSEFVAFTDIKAVPRKKQQAKVKLGSKYAKGYVKKKNPNRSLVENYRSDSEISDIEMIDESNSGSEYLPEEDSEDDWEDKKGIHLKSAKFSKEKVKANEAHTDSRNLKKKGSRKIVDDGDHKSYVKRIKEYEKSELARKYKLILEEEDVIEDEDDYTEFDEGFKIPNSVWNKLYKYQQTGVRWLWELHQQNCGGIIGDEMGLGKTIQVIAFLIGLKFSQLKVVGDVFEGLGPVILVCPATVMHQWVKEFHTWWPNFRVAILHESGSFVGKKEFLIAQINRCKSILITSYAGVVQHQTSLLEKEWHYVILDEGHKIRNPDAQATLVVKQFRTPHRLILSGSPVQNNLKELWSLFDFIFPGKLGTLPVFMQQFSVPIVQGGYANASQVQVQTAFKCATVLRDTIKPYLLRRMKNDVKMSINLPNKSEQVLFCQLSKEQTDLYKAYVNSKEVDSILNARLQVFVGLINLRKICNHPDLFDGGPKILKGTDESTLSEEDHYGYYKRSGKMIVVEALLRLWYKQGHRVLLFTQGRQMMEILEIFVKNRNYTYMKMDGSSSIGSRQPLISKFNSDKSIFVFLLTTRVGGLGVNLTGADRVIIFDPDWNPSTDAQARERSWRIGQDKQVTIYRLLTAGTIEEKIYHRQIFKQFVTNRVLKDPKQRRFFKSNDLYELFTYSEVGAQGVETSAIFAGTGSEVKLKGKNHEERPSEAERNAAFKPMKAPDAKMQFSSEKVEQMKLLAKRLSMELGKSHSPKKDEGESSQTVLAKVDKPRSPATDTPKKGEKHKIHERNDKKVKKKKRAIVDGEKINFLVKKDVYQPPTDETEKNAKDDDYVLSKLFKTTGIHTALKHDKIVESSDSDYAIVEGEAARVAKDAVKALKESRRMCARAEEGIPTWTGQNGGIQPRFGSKKSIFGSKSTASKSAELSKPSPKKLKFDGKNDDSPGVLSSSDLLSAIKKRKHVFGTDDASDEDGDENPTPVLKTNPTTENDELLVDIRNFVAFGGAVDGQASTKEIIDTFRHRLPAQHTAIFKAMLTKICDFSRTSGGEGMWYLKEEFR